MIAITSVNDVRVAHKPRKTSSNGHFYVFKPSPATNDLHPPQTSKDFIFPTNWLANSTGGRLDLSDELASSTGHKLLHLILMAGEGSSSRSSKLPLKRPFEYLEWKPLDISDYWDARELDNPMPQVPLYGTVVEVADPKQVLPMAPPPVKEDLHKGKTKKPKKQIDKDYRDRQKAKFKELENNFRQVKLAEAKKDVLLEESKAQNAMILAALESAKSDMAKAEKNMAHMKCYEGMRKQAMTHLYNRQIEGDVSCNNIGKEELWAQFCNPNGKQIFEKYWEENEKFKHDFRTTVEMFLNVPHE